MTSTGGSPEGTAPPARLTRAQRIQRRADFLRIQDSPARVGTRHLLLLFATGKPGAPARLGVVASRKVGPSVSRSRAKRLVRETFRLHADLFPPGLDVVVIVRPGTHLLKLADLETEVLRARSAIAQRARELLARCT